MCVHRGTRVVTPLCVGLGLAERGFRATVLQVAIGVAGGVALATALVPRMIQEQVAPIRSNIMASIKAAKAKADMVRQEILLMTMVTVLAVLLVVVAIR